MQMELPTQETVRAIIREHQDIFALDRITSVESALIGQGEANLNMLITVNQSQQFNLRIGLRDKESERTLQSEFDILQIVPKGIAPRAFMVDFSRTQLSQPYMLLEYIAGERKQAWQMEDLQTHARTLAHLHQRKFDRHGAIGNLSDAPYDFLYRYDVALRYWQTHHPYLLEIPMVQQLLPPIRHFISTRAALFTDLRRFAII